MPLSTDTTWPPSPVYNFLTFLPKFILLFCLFQAQGTEPGRFVCKASTPPLNHINLTSCFWQLWDMVSPLPLLRVGVNMQFSCISLPRKWGYRLHPQIVLSCTLVNVNSFFFLSLSAFLSSFLSNSHTMTMKCCLSVIGVDFFLWIFFLLVPQWIQQYEKK